MTDTEIIKALETHLSDEGKCSECAYLENIGSCVGIMHKDLYDLINRLQADKEALIAGQETLQKALAEKNEEFENQSQNFKVLVFDHRCLQQSFDHLKGLCEAEKVKVEKAKEKCINLAKELQAAKAEIERLQHNNTRREADFLYLQKTLAEKNAKIKALQMDNAQIQSDNINANMNHEHLQAEIESLDFLIKESNKIAERQDKEIERLQAHNSSMQSTLAKMSMGVKEAKAEAIKEFAERLKAECRQDRYSIQTTTKFGVLDKKYLRVVDEGDIDNLVKEMVGDTE